MKLQEKGHSSLRRGRWSTAGAYYFITFTALNNAPILNNEFNAKIILDQIFALEKSGKILPICCMIMPDHVHLVFQLLTSSLGDCLQKIKGGSSFLINKKNKTEGKIWDNQYYEHFLRTDEALREIVKYCFYNPVRKGLVEQPGQWPYWWCRWQLNEFI